jgi:hypothetical protein
MPLRRPSAAVSAPRVSNQATEDRAIPKASSSASLSGPIYDADTSVFFDLDAKRQDKKDARCCCANAQPSRLTLHRARFDDDPAAWPKRSSSFNSTGRRPTWCEPDCRVLRQGAGSPRRLRYVKSLDG